MSSASSSCTLDLPSTAKDNKKLPQKHVLLLSPRWRSDQHGIAAVTHHLVDNLRTIDPTGSHIKIYCLVALLDQYIGQEEKLEARKSHVVLLGARPPRGDDSLPSAKWLDLYPSMYYFKTLEHLPQMTHIIGHLPYLPNGPTNIRDYCYKGDTSVKIILVNHQAPYNENDDELDEDQLESWCKSADVVVSIGYPLFNFTETVIMSDSSDVKHDLYLPGCPVDFLKYDWMDYHKIGEYGNATETQNILVCCPDRQMSHGLHFQTAVEAIATAGNFLLQESEPRDQVKVTLTLTSSDKDRDQWKRDFLNIMESQFDLKHRQIGLSLRQNENMDKLIAIMNKSNLLVHPQNHESSYLGLDILCAASMGIPVLVQEHSSMACLLEKINPGTTSTVKRLDSNESETEAWSRMIVDKLRDPELAAEQATDIRTGLLRDTSIHRSHVTFIKNIIDPFRLGIDFNSGCKSTSSGEKLGRLFGVNFTKQKDDVTFLASFLSILLHQREKTSVESIHKLIVPKGGEAIDDMVYRLLKSLEGESRYVLDIRASQSIQSTRNELVFDVHCSTVNDITSLYEDLLNSQRDLPRLLMKTLETLADFENATIKVKEHENSQPFPEIGDFKIDIKRKLPKPNGKKPTRGRQSKLPVVKPPLRSKETLPQGRSKDLTNDNNRRRPIRRETYGEGDKTWGIRRSDSLPYEDEY